MSTARAWFSLIADITVAVGLLLAAISGDVAWVLALGFLLLANTILTLRPR